MPETREFADPKVMEYYRKEKAAREAKKKASQEQKTGPEKKDTKNYGRELVKMMEQIAVKVNQEVLDEHGLENLLNPDVSLNMLGYAGNPVPASQVEKDILAVFERDMDNSGARSKDVQDDFKVNTPEEVVPLWRKKKALTQKSYELEMAIAGLLYKVAGGEYLVARASDHDDQTNGVDNVLLNKKTGEVICAFDEVHESGAGERTDKKIQKVKDRAVKGGANVRYGLKMERGKLKRSEMYNVPLFYLGLDKDEFAGLLDGMDFNPDSAVTEAEYTAFGKLVASLKEQKQMLEKLPNVHFAVRKKLETFAGLLEEFKNMGMEIEAA